PDPVRAYEIAQELQAGTVSINGGAGGPHLWGPFGGYKHSGIGREYGDYGLLEYTQLKTVAWSAGRPYARGCHRTTTPTGRSFARGWRRTRRPPRACPPRPRRPRRRGTGSARCTPLDGSASTGRAREAPGAIAPVRTDPDGPKSKGVSMLGIPMTADGVDVRPLRQMTGDSEVNEVYLGDVAVPGENVIGLENEGWRVANTTLANERGGGFIWRQQVRQQEAVDLLWKKCAGAGLLDDPLVRQRRAAAGIG